MPNDQPGSPTRYRTRTVIIVVLAAVSAAVVGCVGYRTSSDPSSSWSSASGIVDSIVHRERHGVADGELPEGVTVFDSDYPAVSNLDPALLDALRRAANDASRSGVEFHVNSGWRSKAYQRQLLDEAVATYGSRIEAARWVATPATSPHVWGRAVDIGPTAASAWLADQGSAYGLCQIYGNEPWHFELRPDAVGHGCPAAFADPTEDPRMQQ